MTMTSLAMIAACVFAVVTGLTGHLYLSIATCLLGSALCVAVIDRQEKRG